MATGMSGRSCVRTENRVGGTRSLCWRPHTVGADQGLILPWRATHDLGNVVGDHVRLLRAGRGQCAWPEHHQHGDRPPAFAVVEKTRTWRCTERISGNADDVLCRCHVVAPRAMVRQVRRFRQSRPRCVPTGHATPTVRGTGGRISAQGLQAGLSCLDWPQA